MACVTRGWSVPYTVWKVVSARSGVVRASVNFPNFCCAPPRAVKVIAIRGWFDPYTVWKVVSARRRVLPCVQRIKMGKNLAGRPAHVWVDQLSVHIRCDGQLVTTVPSNLTAADLHELTLRGAQPAGPPPATAAPARAGRLPAGAAVELDRSVGGDGLLSLDGQPLNVGTQLARQRVTLRLDGHLIHVIAGGVRSKTLPSPIPPDRTTRLRGAGLATTPLPPPPSGAVRVERRVPRDGVVMVTRQRVRVGRVHAGKILTIVVEDTHLRVLHNGEELALHPRTENRPITPLQDLRRPPTNGLTTSRM